MSLVGSNNLTDLKGSPKQVDGGFRCCNNDLTSLEGSPISVGGEFHCGNNKLVNLKGSPEKVGKDFYCFENKLTTLEDNLKSLGLFLYCDETPLESIFNDVNIDFIIAFNAFRVIKDGVVNLKRLKYVMEMFDEPIHIDKIKNYYKVK